MLWSVLVAAALLWPDHLAGLFDGAPLERPLEVVVLALFVLLLLRDRNVLLRRDARLLIVLLLGWKALTTATTTQDGWCVRFTSPDALYLDGVTVPHSWDVRADWRRAVPRCTAVMTRDYRELEDFPAWFFNLPPADPGRASVSAERPPNAHIQFQLSGVLRAAQPGVLKISAGEDVHLHGTVAGRDVTEGALAEGLSLDAGIHDVALGADLTRTHWSLGVTWNGQPPWDRGIALVASPARSDGWFRPWGNWVTTFLTFALFFLVGRHSVERASDRRWQWLSILGAAVLLTAGATAPESVLRLMPLLLIGPALLLPKREMQTIPGTLLLIGLPWVALWLPRAVTQAGVFTWYSAGDDWWMFQRFAYRIYMQGYWLQGGEPTFWFQPLYRWIAGALHLVFGDSSVGELLWDTGAALAGSMFAFAMVKASAGYRWGVIAAVLVLALYTAGPAWYLFGRGMSEFSSAGFLYGGALLASQSGGDRWRTALAAGILATLACFTRLNNLPMAVAVVVFAFPVTTPASAVWRPGSLWTRFSRPTALAVLAAFACGLWLFTARTYYYTGVPSMLHGTTAAANSVWIGEPGIANALGRVGSSLAMLITMNDPPRFDPRAVPVIGGVLMALAALLGSPRLRTIPLNVTLFCLAGLAGGLVARGVAYPGRFSIHLIPAAVTVCCCGLAALTSRRRDHADQSGPVAHAD